MAQRLVENYIFAMSCCVLCTVAGIVLIVLIATLRAMAARVRDRAAALAAHRRTHRPDGRPYPPASAGVCGRCRRALARVYYLPDGRALCPACYDDQVP